MIVRRLLSVTLVLAAALIGSQGARGQAGEAPLPLDPIARMAALDERIAGSISEIEQAEADRDRARAELQALLEGRSAANRRLGQRVRALYRISRAGALPLAGGFEALLGHLARTERLERMVRRDAEALRTLRVRAEELRDETGRLAERIELARARVTSLQAQKTALAEDAHRASVYAAAFGESVAPGTATAAYDPATGYGIRVLDPAPAPAGFESQRGQLALPLAAPRAVREARREDGLGVELDGARGDAVRVAASGRVAFSDRHPSYGRLVIVDHGGGWFTVYGGLARVEVEVGDHLSRGMHVGAVDGEPLFFQVRRGTRALDARAWLGI